jgi:hypothetical protein
MVKTDLLGMTIEGYTIIKQGDIAVIAECQIPYGNQYVAWHYKNNNGEVDCFWGRYGSREYAEECFEKKEKGVYSGD